MLWRGVFVALTLCVATVVLPQLNSALVAGRVRSRSVLPTVLRRARPPRPKRASLPAWVPPDVLSELRRAHPDRELTVGPAPRTLFRPGEARAYVTAGGAVSPVRRGRPVPVAWRPSPPGDAPLEGYPVSVSEEGRVTLAEGRWFSNPRVDMRAVTDDGTGDVSLTGGADPLRHTRPPPEAHAQALMEVAAGRHGREARAVVAVRPGTPPDTVRMLQRWAQLCFSEPDRAAREGDLVEVHPDGGGLTVRGVRYPDHLSADATGLAPGAHVAKDVSGRTMRLGGAEVPNPVRVVRDGASGRGEDGAGPLLVGTHPEADVALAEEPAGPVGPGPNAPGLRWVPDGVAPDGLSGQDAARLWLELDGALRGRPRSGEFRLLERANDSWWWTAATCRMAPGRLPAVLMFGKPQRLEDLVPEFVPPDCREPSVGAVLHRRDLSGTERSEVGTYGGFAAARAHGSEEVRLQLRCPASGTRTLKALRGRNGDAVRTVVQIPERCDTPPCVQSADVAGVAA